MDLTLVKPRGACLPAPVPKNQPEDAGRRVSLRDIARRAKLSHATVSMALRDHPDIALKTRRLVGRLADEMGYRPDPLLRALAEYRRGKKGPHYRATLAWINNYPEPGELERFYDFSLYRKWAEERAGELGFKLEEFTPVKDGLSPDKLRKILLARGIHGLLLPPQPAGLSEWAFDFREFFAVTFGFSLKKPRLHVVANHQFHSSLIAFRKLRDYGHRRLGFVINDNLDLRSDHAFTGGFLGAQNRLPPDEKIPVLVIKRPLHPDDWELFWGWFQEHRPEAIITELPTVRSFLEEKNIRVPEDVSVALMTMNDREPLWGGVNQNAGQIGRAAVDILAGMFYRNERGIPAMPHCMFVESSWQDGPSVRKRL